MIDSKKFYLNSILINLGLVGLGVLVLLLSGAFSHSYPTYTTRQSVINFFYFLLSYYVYIIVWSVSRFLLKKNYRLNGDIYHKNEFLIVKGLAIINLIIVSSVITIILFKSIESELLSSVMVQLPYQFLSILFADVVGFSSASWFSKKGIKSTFDLDSIKKTLTPFFLVTIFLSILFGWYNSYVVCMKETSSGCESYSFDMKKAEGLKLIEAEIQAFDQRSQWRQEAFKNQENDIFKFDEIAQKEGISAKILEIKPLDSEISVDVEIINNSAKETVFYYEYSSFMIESTNQELRLHSKTKDFKYVILPGDHLRLNYLIPSYKQVIFKQSVGDNRYFKFKIDDPSKYYKAQNYKDSTKLPILESVQAVDINNSIITNLFEVLASKRDQNQIRLEIKNITNYPLPVKPTSNIVIADLTGQRYNLNLENIDNLPEDGFWLDQSKSYSQDFVLKDKAQEKCSNSPCRAYFKLTNQISDLSQGEVVVDF